MTDLARTDGPDFPGLCDKVLLTVAESSQPTYRQVYDAWAAWCAGQGIHPLALSVEFVTRYLVGMDTTVATRERHLIILRRLAKVLALQYKHLDPRLESMYEFLLMMRVPTKDAGGQERNKRALDPAEVDAVLNVWDGWQLKHIRNRAIIALLFATGLRRSECAALRWQDINLAAGLVTVWHGKGDKYREAAIVGEAAVRTLREWRDVQEISGQREWVFCPLVKGDALGDDVPVTDKTIYNVVKATAKRAGVAFAPHDARRTLITELLKNDGILADVQAQAGHTDPKQTLEYAQPAQAQQRRGRMKVRW